MNHHQRTWGTSWIVDDLLTEELEVANLESSFEDMMSEVYPPAFKIKNREIKVKP